MSYKAYKEKEINYVLMCLRDRATIVKSENDFFKILGNDVKKYGISSHIKEWNFVSSDSMDFLIKNKVIFIENNAVALTAKGKQYINNKVKDIKLGEGHFKPFSVINAERLDKLYAKASELFKTLDDSEKVVLSLMDKGATYAVVNKNHKRSIYTNTDNYEKAILKINRKSLPFYANEAIKRLTTSTFDSLEELGVVKVGENTIRGQGTQIQYRHDLVELTELGNFLASKCKLTPEIIQNRIDCLNENIHKKEQKVIPFSQ
mgnify:CR=1 FL=1|jgi:hypothetical protein